MIINVCIALLLPAILGFLIITVILRTDSETFLGERIGYAFPIGAGLLAIQIFILGLLRIPLTLYNTSVPVFLEITLLAIWIWQKNITLIPRPTFGLVGEFVSSQNNWIKKIVFLLLTLWIMSKIISVFIFAGLRPIFAWDAWANWSAGAKVFFYSHSLMLDTSLQDFFGKNAVDRNIFYPLHNSLMQVWMSLWLGKFDDVFVKFFSPVYLLSMTLCLYYATAREINRIFALAFLAIFLSSPLLSYHSTELYSDQMLGVYLFFASLSFLKAMRGNNAYWLLTGISSAGAMFTKNEAFFFITPLILSATAYCRYNININKKFINLNFIFLFIPLLFLLPWYGFKLYYELNSFGYCRWQIAHTTSFWTEPSTFSFKPEMLGSYLHYLISLENFNVIFFFFPMLLLASKNMSKEFLHLLFPMICYGLFFFMMYLVVVGFYSSYSMILARNILTFYPITCLLTVMLLKQHMAWIPGSGG